MFGIKRIVKNLLRRYNNFYVNSQEVKRKADLLTSQQGSLLDKYGFVSGTDKASIMPGSDPAFIAHDYLRHYDYLFHSFRGEKFSLIEFGCLDGASLRMWEKYFPNAQIYGVDLDETAKRHETERIHVVIGDATEQKTFDELKSAVTQAFIILDDASHAWGDQRRSFELFWDLVAPGGFFVIEDLVCGSMGAYPAYPPKVLDSQPFFKYMQDRCEFLQWCPDWEPEKSAYLFKYMPAHIQKIEREMDICVFIPGAVIVRKKSC
ncbi:MAG: class I SAM-dependent methyltransferase [Synergistaceae bacterium]|nr:class I SAM-dependent methyltransferase [Synergistaceae bacterium]